MRLSKANRRHRQKQRNAAKTKKDKRKAKATRDNARMERCKSATPGVPKKVYQPKVKKPPLTELQLARQTLRRAERALSKQTKKSAALRAFLDGFADMVAPMVPIKLPRVPQSQKKAA